MKKLYIVKIGGNIIDDELSLSSFLKDFSSIKGNKVLVHGGGKLASKLGELLGIKQELIDGRRVTDKNTLEIVTMVYAGLINKKITAGLQSHHINAIGISGADLNIIKAKKRETGQVDYGWVGDIEDDGINSEMLELLLSNDIVPVCCAITHDGGGQLLNTNADTIAASLSIALAKKYKVNLVYCFEKKGILKNREEENSYINKIDPYSYNHLKNEGIINEGMIPKMDNALSALNSKVNKVWIGHAKNLISMINEHEAIGTLISL